MRQSLVTGKYDRVAPVYDLLEAPVEFLLYSRWRRRLYRGLVGRILEIGSGTGRNVPNWPLHAPPAALEPAPAMAARTRRRARVRGIEPAIVRGVAQALPFPDGCFDAVVASFVFCSVAEPAVGLAEVKRVLRPEGEVRLLEHQRPRVTWLARAFDALNPLVLRLTGVNINRETTDKVREAGFREVAVEELDPFGVFRLIRAMRRLT